MQDWFHHGGQGQPRLNVGATSRSEVALSMGLESFVHGSAAEIKTGSLVWMPPDRTIPEVELPGLRNNVEGLRLANGSLAVERQLCHRDLRSVD